MDLVICADTVHTLEPGAGAVTAVGVRDGRIAAVGTRDDVPGWTTSATTVLDLGDATLVPGLVDAHVHPVMGARMTLGVGLLELDLEGVRAALAERASGLPDDAWVLGWGLDPNIVPDGVLTSSLVDEAVGGRPALLRLFDGHSALASTAALTLAGVTGPRTFDQQSEVVCAPDGTPTGMLLESAAIELVERHVPQPSLDELAAATRDALAAMAEQGIAAAHSLEHEAQASAVYDLIERDGDLPVRLRCSPWCLPGTDESDWQAIADLQGTGGRRWTVEGVKLFIDGTIDNGTAWLLEPDTLGESTRPYWPDPASYSRAIAWFDAHDVPTTTHAIGDHGVRHVLDALARTSGRVRHRVEHIETIPDDLVEAFSRLDVTASMQPTHATEYTLADGTDNWSRRLGPGRAAHGWRTRDLREAGVRVALGSDWPIAACDPRGVIAAAQLRRRGGDPSRAPVQPDQSLSALMALEGYTTHATWSVGHDDRTGTIAVGKVADLSAFALDPLTSDPDDFATAEVVLTLVDGTPSYRPTGRTHR
ncbi:amidohydrolase [Aeromicrobium sp. IC_218]|uniref:amidohydrolase n=1 Tax=Aeromicrobium sp. IC_218 TaxID=2545468 RepID=UPI00103EBE94|nr:amidohydrolase [Aeromicrobium sp. IC_218]TCI98841.1 amidohydrolase [Aeromicrobium sp. IC_218]